VHLDACEVSDKEARARRRHAARDEANAALCKLPLTDWLRLPKAERKRRLAAARATP
jgi:hypothetical protein